MTGLAEAAEEFLAQPRIAVAGVSRDAVERSEKGLAAPPTASVADLTR